MVNKTVVKGIFIFNATFICIIPLDESNLASHLHGILLSRQPNVGLLDTIRAHQSVHLGCLHPIQLLHSSPNMVLVGTSVAQKDQRVARLHLAHGRLGRQWGLDHGIVVEGGLDGREEGGGAANVGGAAGEGQGFGEAEGGGVAGLAGGGFGDTRGDGLGALFGLAHGYTYG